ncbi:DUF58 domain-containing protein [Candidatus Woesearchaeota archaeon]|nr:DUF58 domain-containing protein [Candidatus Woesearchaeota archaeon]
MKRKLNVNLVPSIRKLEVVTKGLIKTKGIGSYKSVFRGKGLEFSDYRAYNLEDDSALIDWKASLRTNQLLMRQYEEERDLMVFFLFDCSSSMIFGSTEKLKNEYAVEMVASLAYTILDAGDSVGLVMFNDKIVHKVAPGKGKGQFYSLIRALRNVDNYGGGYDFGKAVEFVLNYLKQSAIVFIVSDFIGLNESVSKNLEVVSARFDTIGVMIRDPRDKVLPDDVGQVVIEDPYSKQTLLIEPELIKDIYEEEIKKQENEIKELFLKNRSDFISLTTDKSFMKPVLNLFRERSLKWR